MFSLTQFAQSALSLIENSFFSAGAGLSFRKTLSGSSGEYDSTATLLDFEGTSASSSAPLVDTVLATLVAPANAIPVGASCEVLFAYSSAGAGSKTHKVRMNGVLIHELSSTINGRGSTVRMTRLSPTVTIVQPLTAFTVDSLSAGAPPQVINDIDWTSSVQFDLSTQVATASGIIRLQFAILRRL